MRAVKRSLSPGVGAGSPCRAPLRGANALILAAGRGARLGTGAPKCLAPIGGRTLVEPQLDALEEVGVDDVTIVVGFQADAVSDIVAGRARLVLNERYAETNSLYSFLLGCDAVASGGFVINADVLFESSILARIVTSGQGAVAFDSCSGDDDEHMKVALQGIRLVEMRKDLERRRTCGENLGLLRLGRRAASTTIAAARAIVAAGGQNDWLASAVNVAAVAHVIRCVDVAGTPWIEIDYPEDLERARRDVWPRIAEGLLEGTHPAATARDGSRHARLQLAAGHATA